jgi:hypothetical protein
MLYPYPALSSTSNAGLQYIVSSLSAYHFPISNKLMQAVAQLTGIQEVPILSFS